MTDTERLKLAEDIRFQIERNWYFFISDNKTKIKSFTVILDKGTVKSVRLKIDELYLHRSK